MKLTCVYLHRNLFVCKNDFNNETKRDANPPKINKGID